MKVAVPKETVAGERRVALTPEAAAALVKDGMEILLETGTGDGAFHTERRVRKGRRPYHAGRSRPLRPADIVVKVPSPASTTTSTTTRSA
jgi:H+-translocating NAD(P) transhydrogenase subunit alpha